MSVSTIINPLTGKIDPRFIPGGAPGSQNLDEVLTVGNTASKDINIASNALFVDTVNCAKLKPIEFPLNTVIETEGDLQVIGKITTTDLMIENNPNPKINFNNGVDECSLVYEPNYGQISTNGVDTVTVNSSVNPGFGLYNSSTNSFGKMSLQNNNILIQGDNVNNVIVQKDLVCDGVGSFNNSGIIIRSQEGGYPYLVMDNSTTNAVIVYDNQPPGNYNRFYFGGAGVSCSNFTSIDGDQPYLQLYDTVSNVGGQLRFEGANNRFTFNKDIKPISIIDAANSAGSDGKVLKSYGSGNMYWVTPNQFTIGTINLSYLFPISINSSTYTNILYSISESWTGSLSNPNGNSYKIMLNGDITGVNDVIGAYISIYNVTQNITYTTDSYDANIPYVCSSNSFPLTIGPVTYVQYVHSLSITDTVNLSPISLNDNIQIRLYVKSKLGIHPLDTNNKFLNITLIPQKYGF